MTRRELTNEIRKSFVKASLKASEGRIAAAIKDAEKGIELIKTLAELDSDEREEPETIILDGASFSIL